MKAKVYSTSKCSWCDRVVSELTNNGIEVENQKLQYLTAILGVSFNKFLFSYTYSSQMGNVKFSNGSFHQITLGFDFLGGREPYDCNCPAIN